METTCSTCGRTYIFDRKSGHRKHKCNSCYVNDRRFTLKMKAVEYKGGKCSICGYDKCHAALGFHHANPKSKDFKISGSHSRSWTAIKNELDKCILVCCRCHREIHAELDPSLM